MNAYCVDGREETRPHVASDSGSARRAHGLDGRELVAELVADGVHLVGPEAQLLADLVELGDLLGADAVTAATAKAVRRRPSRCSSVATSTQSRVTT